MTAQPRPYLEFRPTGIDALVITSVGELNAEQVAAVTGPFKLGEKPRSIFTAQTFDVTCDLSGVTLSETWLLKAYAWVIGSAAQLAPISYLPVPTKPLKSKLWRLSPDQTGAEARDADTVTVTLPQPYGIARVAVECRGLFDVTEVFVPTPEAP